MNRAKHISQLIQADKLDQALAELHELAQGTYEEQTAIILLSRYNGIKREAVQGIITEESWRMNLNRLKHSAQSVLEMLVKEKPDLMEAQVDMPAKSSADSPGKAPVIHNYNASNQTIIHGNPIFNITYLQQQMNHLEALASEEQKAGFITNEEYEELMDVLDEIKEQDQPKDERQKRKWKRWLGKMAQTGRKFMGKRMENAIDKGVGEWLRADGLDKIGEVISSLG